MKEYGYGYGYGNGYVGQVTNGKEHGHGKATWSDGRVYEGEWNDGWRHGHGKLTYADGRVLEGRWERGDFLQKKFFACVEQAYVVKASQLFTDNKTYLDKNARNTNGLTAIEVAVKKYHWDMLEWLLDNGIKCKGVGKIVDTEYRFEIVKGLDCYRYDDVGYDYVYVGQVWNGKRHGHGKATYLNGEAYEGEWKNSFMHGHGKKTNANGRVKKGRFEDGYFKG